MEGEEKVFEKHRASSQTGIDYQFYYFIYYTLCMENMEDEVGYEEKDDVHIKLKQHGNKITLCQIKHSNDDASIIDTSVDLWNTLATWAEVLSNSTNKEQYAFAFVANKENKSQFINTIININQQGVNDENIKSIREKIKEINKKTIKRKKKKEKKSTVEEHQETVLNLDDKSFKLLFSNIIFSFSDEDIVSKCIDIIYLKFYYSKEKARAIFDTYFSRIAEDKYKSIKKHGFLSLTYKELRKEYGSILVPQQTKLQTRNNFKILPDTDEHIFLKQLYDISYIEEDDKDKEIELRKDKLYASNNINEWLQEGDVLTTANYEKYRTSAIKAWNNKFDKHYRKFKTKELDEDTHNEMACDIVDEVKEIKDCFGISDDITFNNGVFWMLSDEPIIGWRKDWEKYKPE